MEAIYKSNVTGREYSEYQLWRVFHAIMKKKYDGNFEDWLREKVEKRDFQRVA